MSTYDDLTAFQFKAGKAYDKRSVEEFRATALTVLDELLRTNINLETRLAMDASTAVSPPVLGPDEQEILDRYRRLSPPDRWDLLQRLEGKPSEAPPRLSELSVTAPAPVTASVTQPQTPLSPFADWGTAPLAAAVHESPTANGASGWDSPLLPGQMSQPAVDWGSDEAADMTNWADWGTEEMAQSANWGNDSFTGHVDFLETFSNAESAATAAMPPVPEPAGWPFDTNTPETTSSIETLAPTDGITTSWPNQPEWLEHADWAEPDSFSADADSAIDTVDAYDPTPFPASAPWPADATLQAPEATWPPATFNAAPLASPTAGAASAVGWPFEPALHAVDLPLAAVPHSRSASDTLQSSGWANPEPARAEGTLPPFMPPVSTPHDVSVPVRADNFREQAMDPFSESPLSADRLDELFNQLDFGPPGTDLVLRGDAAMASVHSEFAAPLHVGTAPEFDQPLPPPVRPWEGWIRDSE